jgi:hypothetical protein
MEIRQANWKFDILNLAIQLFSKIGFGRRFVSSSNHVKLIRIIIILVLCIPNSFGAPLITPIQSHRFETDPKEQAPQVMFSL